MGIEIERKFLVNGEFRSGEPELYRQGYLSRSPSRTVRIRIANQAAWMTVKSLSTDIIRQEFEYPIPRADAEEMLALCEATLIEKYRWKIPHADHLWEVDEFLGANAGLIVAEIELSSVDEEFARPGWIGREVSHELRYQNSQLTRFPFSSWKT